MILDALSITESGDPAVEDALILVRNDPCVSGARFLISSCQVMDRFESLRSCMNDPAIRRSLLIKIRHSIHCKKWRVKKQMIKGESCIGQQGARASVVTSCYVVFVSVSIMLPYFKVVLRKLCL